MIAIFIALLSGCSSPVQHYTYTAPAQVPPTITIVKNVYDPKTTSITFDKNLKECSYEAEKVSAGKTYFDTQSVPESLQRIVVEQPLIKQCMAAKGYVETNSTDKKDILLVDKLCPGKKYCFVGNEETTIPSPGWAVHH